MKEFPRIEISTIEQLGIITNTVAVCVDLLTDKIKGTDQFRTLDHTVDAIQSVAVKISKERKALIAKLDDVTAHLETFRDDKTWTNDDLMVLLDAHRFIDDARRGQIELPVEKPELKEAV